MKLCGHLVVILVELFSWILSVGSERLHILSLEITSLRGVSLPRQAPLWSLSPGSLLVCSCLIHSLVWCFPVRGHSLRGLRHIRRGLIESNSTFASLRQRTLSLSTSLLHSLSHLLESADSGVIEQIRVVSILVIDYRDWLTQSVFSLLIVLAFLLGTW